MVHDECNGLMTFRVYLPHAQSVSLVADFTGWCDQPLALHPEGSSEDREDDSSPACTASGWWALRTHIPTGPHAFSYLVDEHWWLPDYAAHGVRRDPEGHWTSLLFVPPTPRIETRVACRQAACHAAN